MFRCASCGDSITSKNIIRKKGDEKLNWYSIYYANTTFHCKNCGAELIFKGQGLLLLVLALALSIALIIYNIFPVPRIIIFGVLFLLVVITAKKVVTVDVKGKPPVSKESK